MSTVQEIALRGPGRPRDERATSAITEAALHQLEEIGYGRLSMESVAAEAGVARTTIYRRYRDKADLVTAAIATARVTDSSLDGSADPRGELKRFLVHFEQDFVRSCLELVGALISNRDDPSGLLMHRERVIAPRIAYARGLLEMARDAGQLREDADLDLALEMLIGPVIARAVSGGKSRSGWAERSLDVVWKAMS